MMAAKPATRSEEEPSTNYPMYLTGSAMKAWHSFKRVAGWLVGAPDRSFRFRMTDMGLWWVLISLLSISLIADHPHVALTIAILGGTIIGVLCVMGSKPLR